MVPAKFIIVGVFQDYSRKKIGYRHATLQKAVRRAKKLRKVMAEVRWFECKQYNETLQSGVIIIK